jgi:asparagine synthase (glutamine-hydrolysing)
MCGIAGLILARPIDLDEAVRLAGSMADTLIHRGPDAFGSHIDPSRRVVLAHRRLAILDLSPAGQQPMTSRSGRWTVVFNGEIYNHVAVRAELGSRGTEFRGHSDTETMVEAIDRWGIDEALLRTNGMFAIAAWDSHCARLLLARDRLGEKPLYWTHQGGTFAFASELRGLRAVPNIDLRIDPHAAAAMLRWSFVPRPGTIYQDVRQLAPGGLLAVGFDHERIDVDERAWWSLSDTISSALGTRTTQSLDAAADELEPLLADAVALRLQSDVPLGAFLSGGIDSSLVAALAQRGDRTGSLRTFTVAMPEIGFDESAHAATVARHLGSDHTSVRLTAADAFELVPRLPRIWDEPFADPSMLPNALLCQAAREHLSVCLGGDGGDELFAGYNRHAMGASMHRRLARLPTGVRRAAAAAAMWPAPDTIDRFGDVANRLLPASRRPSNLGDKLQKVAAMLGSDAAAWETFAQVWPQSALGVVASHPAIPHTTLPIDDIERMMLADTAVVLSDQMLVKVDRASMAASLEVRSPLLDHRLLEWAWRQPIDVKTRGGVGKLVLRRVAERVLPAEIADRPKMGFDPPLAGWLRNELRPWAADLLADPRSVGEGWIDGAAVQRAWSEHSSGTRNWDYRLWGVLMLESWLAEHHPH